MKRNALLFLISVLLMLSVTGCAEDFKPFIRSEDTVTISKDEYELMVDKALKMQAQRFKKYKPIKFSYDEYPGYACETTHNGYGQKGVYFVKENYIIALTVISNNNLEAKFNKFTNSFKSLTTN